MKIFIFIILLIISIFFIIYIFNYSLPLYHNLKYLLTLVSNDSVPYQVLNNPEAIMSIYPENSKILSIVHCNKSNQMMTYFKYKDFYLLTLHDKKDDYKPNLSILNFDDNISRRCVMCFNKSPNQYYYVLTSDQKVSLENQPFVNVLASFNRKIKYHKPLIGSIDSCIGINSCKQGHVWFSTNVNTSIYIYKIPMHHLVSRKIEHIGCGYLKNYLYNQVLENQDKAFIKPYGIIHYDKEIESLAQFYVENNFTLDNEYYQVNDKIVIMIKHKYGKSLYCIENNSDNFMESMDFINIDWLIDNYTNILCLNTITLSATTVESNQSMVNLNTLTQPFLK